MLSYIFNLYKQNKIMAKNWTSEFLGSQLGQGAILLCLNLSLSNKKTKCALHTYKEQSSLN